MLTLNYSFVFISRILYSVQPVSIRRVYSTIYSYLIDAYINYVYLFTSYYYHYENEVPRKKYRYVSMHL